MMAEFRLPLDGPQVLLDRRSADGSQVFSVLHDTAAGLSVLHRQGGAVARHTLPGPLPLDRATGQMKFAWDAGRDHWRLEFGLLGGDARAAVVAAQGRGALPLQGSVLSDLGTGRGQRHSSLLWFGVTEGAMPLPRPWIGPRSLVPTAKGAVAAEDLRPGDLVITANGPVPVLSLDRPVVPARGSFQPVLLRAPWFGRVDLLVSAQQLVQIDGPEAEYLFGEDQVLVPAGLLVDGRSALAEGRRAVVTGVALNLGTAELVNVQGCPLCSEPATGTALPLRLLDRYEAVPLMAQLGRLPQRAVG